MMMKKVLTLLEMMMEKMMKRKKVTREAGEKISI